MTGMVPMWSLHWGGTQWFQAAQVFPKGSCIVMQNPCPNGGESCVTPCSGALSESVRMLYLDFEMRELEDWSGVGDGCVLLLGVYLGGLQCLGEMMTDALPEMVVQSWKGGLPQTGQ